MDRELKEDSIKLYETRRVEAEGRKAMLEKLLVDKQAEHAAEILAIQTNIAYWQTQLVQANKMLTKLALEAAASMAGEQPV